MLLTSSIWLSVSLILTIIVLVVIIIRRKHNYFIAANIPGPKPSFLLGNFDTLWRTSKYFRQLESWTRQYGKIYGIFEGTLPIYVVSDVDFLEEVFIKQFSNFETRKPILFLLAEQEKRTHLVTSVGARWRRQRYVINPIFSKSKLMSMGPIINGCVDKLLEILQSYADRNVDVDIQPLYTQLMMDSVCQCIFSLKTGVQGDPENIYLKQLKSFFGTDNRKLLFVKVTSVVPLFIGTFIFRLIIRINELMVQLNKRFSLQFNELPYLWMLSRIGEHILRARQENGKNRRADLLSLMLKAATDQKIIDVNYSLTDTSSIPNKLTYGEIVGNTFLFFASGTETTAITLSYCTFVLATHPNIQQKLREEIDSNFVDNNQSLTYDAVEELIYLDIFIKEVTRMYPVAPIVVNRLCVEDTTIGQHKIRKGTVIQVDMYTIHYDIDLWGPIDPYEFYPERHLTRRHPLAYLFFGAGPRQCVGIRLAILELKIALVRLLQTFIISKTDELSKISLDVDLTSIGPERVPVKLERRSPIM